MFSIDLQRTAAAAVAALLFTTTFVGAAVAPSHGIEAGAVQLAHTQAASADNKLG